MHIMHLLPHSPLESVIVRSLVISHVVASCHSVCFHLPEMPALVDQKKIGGSRLLLVAQKLLLWQRCFQFLSDQQQPSLNFSA